MTDKSTRTLAGLDALRLTAEVMVFACHLGYYGLALLPGLLGVAQLGLREGVVLFFVLSGYLLYRPFVVGQVSLRDYFARRFARILPAYWLALVGVTLLSGDSTFVRDPIRFLVFAQNFDPATFNGFLGVTWTLALEMTFYAVLPLLAAAVRRFGVRWLIAMGLISFAGQFAVWQVGSAIAQDWQTLRLVASAFPVVLWCFVPGMLIARFQGEPALAWMARPAAACLGVLLLLLGSPSLEWATNNVLAVIGSALLVGWAVSHPDLRLPRWVAGGAAISYSAYLWHVDIMRAVASLPGASLLAALATIALSSTAYVFVERPARRIVRSRRASRIRRTLGDVHFGGVADLAPVAVSILDQP
jgi:peptidoglycan/LPS O-acetylase OafA/YrhL